MEAYAEPVDFFAPIFFYEECAKVHPKMCLNEPLPFFLWHIFLFFWYTIMYGLQKAVFTKRH